MALLQYQCQKEGDLFYHQQDTSSGTNVLLVEFCPVCGSKRVDLTGRRYANLDESALLGGELTADSELFVTEEIRDLVGEMLDREDVHVGVPDGWRYLNDASLFPGSGKADLWICPEDEEEIIGTVEWTVDFGIGENEAGRYIEAAPGAVDISLRDGTTHEWLPE